MTSWYIASGEWVRPECNCQIYKEANWQTHTDGKITNPYMHTGRAEQPGGDDETQTKTLTHRRAPVTTEALLKVSDICLLVLLFFFLDAQIAQWMKTERAPWSAEAEYVHFLFPKPFPLTGSSTFFSLLFSFFLIFPFSSKIIFQQQLPSPLYSTGKTLMQKAECQAKAVKGLRSFLLSLHVFDDSSSWTHKLFQFNSVLSSFASHYPTCKATE